MKRRKFIGKYFRAVFAAILLLFLVNILQAEDGCRLWLRYDKIPEQKAKIYRSKIKSLFIDGNSETVKAIQNELETGLSGLPGEKLSAIQERDAIWWKDASLSYFQTLSKMPLPKGVEKPERTLEEYKTIDLLDDYAKGKAAFDLNHK